MIKVVIFDFDGVLVDSPAIKHQAFFDLFKDAKPDEKQIAYAQIEKTRGQPRYEKFRQIFTALGHKPKDIEKLVQIYTRKYNRLAEKLIIEKGLPANTMQVLKSLGKKYILYINSTTPQSSLRLLAKNLKINNFFRGIYGLPSGRTNTYGAKQENLQKIFEKANINPSQAVFVGDQKQDLEAAKLFDCAFIGVSNKTNAWVNTNYPLISNLSGLKKILSKQFSNDFPIFTPNIHSKYKIFWKTISQKQQTTLKELISKYYLFSAQGQIKQVDEWETRSNNFLIKINGKKVVLRKHIRQKDPKRILAIDKILDFLTKSKILVPRLIKTEDGKDFFFKDGHYWQLFEYINGDHYRGTQSQLKQIAKEIAKLHLALKRCKILLPKTDVNTSPTLSDWKKIIDLARSKNGVYDRIFISNFDFILENFMLAKQKLGNLKGLRTQIIRGDLHPHDTIFEKDKFKSFLDFEGVRKSQLIRDVANACHRFARQFVVYQNKPWIKTLPYAIRIFLSEYQKINPLNKKEIQLLPFFIIDETLAKIYRILSRHYLAKSALVQNELKKQLVLLKEAKVIERIFNPEFYTS